MPAYTLAHLHTFGDVHPDLVEYLESVQDTLDPYSGRFMVHGGEVEAVEGSWPGTVVVIEFPDTAAARAWYDSPAYQAIRPLRTDHIDGDVIIVDGVAPGYHPSVAAAALRALGAGGA